MPNISGKLTHGELFDIVRAADETHVIWRPVGGIGDAIMMLPALTALKQNNGSSITVMAVVDYIEPVFQGHEAVDYIYRLGAFRKVGKQKRLAEYDERYLSALAKVGAEFHKFYDPCPAATYEAKYNPYIERSRQEIFCDHIGVEFNIDNYHLELAEAENWIPRGLGLPDRYVVVQIKSYDKWRDYKYMAWLLQELVRLGKKRDFQVVAIDKDLSSGVKGVRDLVGMDLRHVFAIVKKSLLLIGPDSMGVHVAGAMNKPTLGLFGPTNPEVRLKYNRAYWMPRLKRCRRQYCWYTPCRFEFCLSVVRPRRIINKVKKILKEAEL